MYLVSLLWGTFCCDVDMYARKHCTSCSLQPKTLNVKSFLKKPKVLIWETNLCYDELGRQLSRTRLDIPSHSNLTLECILLETMKT